MTSIEHILDMPKLCMISAGIWRLPLPVENVILKKTYTVYRKFVRVCFPIFLASLCIQCTLTLLDKNSSKTTEELFKQLSYFITLLIVEVATILWQRDEVLRLISFVYEEEEKIFRSGEKIIIQAHLKQVHFCKNSNWIVLVFTLFAGSTMILETYWRRFEVEKYNREHNATLPVPFLFELYCYKFDAEKHAAVLHYVNDFAAIINGFRIVSTKTIFFSCIMFVPSVLKQLCIRFRKMGTYEDDIFVILRHLILEHQEVNRFVKKLNDCVKYLILMEYLLDSLNVAATSIQFITYDRKMLASPIFYISHLFVQTFILAWNANEVKIQSLALADAIYDSPWYKQTMGVKKSLLTVILRAQRPLLLTIGPFDAMTTQSGLAIMKASYSYVTLMMNNY
ncbi:odorant receptor 45b-like isoform X2 [Cylas formicarius]|uniref:odorant receptor 45b-like isoform X2 n=1 Tax=Cylas formicarius TaxID=197179 RepID=UPI0029589756|nr:odorant receptor 45b-like isoform X2 [Cylas formicarius]